MDLLWRNKNFSILFFGRVLTNIGDSLYYIAAMWLVYELGGNPFYSGLAGFLTLLPKSLQFITGPLVDRWQIKKTLVITQVLQFIMILIIPIAYYFNALSVELVLIIMPIVSFIEQFAYPSQTKALPLILKKEQLIQGNSLFSFAYQGIDMIFTAFGGVLVALMGAVTLYLVDSITFAITAILFSFLTISQKSTHPLNNQMAIKQANTSYINDLKEGFSIVFHSLLAVSLLGAIICNFAIGVSMAVLPSFSNLKGGVDIYGYMLAAQSTGMLIGAVFSSWIGRFRVGLFTIIAFALGSICWTASGLVPWTTMSIVLFGLAWIPIGATNVLLGTVWQTVIPNRFLGRVNSVTYSMSAIAMPVGSLLGGYFASTFNSIIIFAFSGAGLIVISIVWLLHPQLRALPSVKEIGAESFGLKITEKEVM